MENATQFEALVIACLDGRFRAALDDFLAGEKKLSLFDYIRTAGASLRLACEGRERSEIFSDIALVYEKHGVRRFMIIEHENCGKYAAEGLVAGSQEEERELHDARSREAEEFLGARFPDISVERYYAALDGAITPLT